MNSPLLSHPVGRVRLVGWIEGVSYLLLLGIAMPLKYFAGIPEAVKVVGWAHGVLFIGLALLVAIAWLGKRLSFKDSALVMIAALLPFGPFFIDKRLAAREARD
ncbi:DUF3817 domain-containing protein [Haloferula sp. A504]|jgi:integral membrane protein|uniref:DUF3817 domain-containing protein n=1 Tax=Haloferula sp. A504 TaxID=3373601 RepID=UPI0031C0E627|nr:DUF3817 domain-containing protein [Verrucomicrobiaceae bacterium E54]